MSDITEDDLPEYCQFLSSVANQIRDIRIHASRAVNKAAISLYWWLGEHIVKKQEEFGWGRSVVERLSKDLKRLFPDAPYGFSSRNLWDMRRLYLAYKEFPKLRKTVAEIPWSQNLLILNKIKDNSERFYYLNATRNQAWTRSILSQQIQSNAYERHCASKQNNFSAVLPEQLAEQADQSMKDVYMFDMFGIAEPILESEIERRLVDRIKDVILELGYGFCFMGNQYRVSTPESEYFIDLLFYHRQLRSLVAIELKRSRFKPEYAGKMNFYLNLLDEFVKEPHENPSIGIILCGEKSHFDVEYALRGIDKPVGVAGYQLTRQLPDELKSILPEVEHLEREIRLELGL